MMQTVAHESPEPVASATAGWMVLALDGLRMALPQRDIRLVGLVSDLSLSADGEWREAGWLSQKNGDSWPVYCFDEALDLHRVIPEGRHICLFLRAGSETIGILCNRVWSLAADADIVVEPLPACMTGLPSPVVGVARHPDGVVVVLGAVEIAAYLDFLRKREYGADQ